mgnify:CR=1 FL=1
MDEAGLHTDTTDQGAMRAELFADQSRWPDDVPSVHALVPSHPLRDTALFSDAALAFLLEAGPGVSHRVVQLNETPASAEPDQAGQTSTKIVGSSALAAAAHTPVWIEIDDPIRADVRYEAWLNELYGSIDRFTKTRTSHRRMRIVVASPGVVARGVAGRHWRGLVCIHGKLVVSQSPPLAASAEPVEDGPGHSVLRAGSILWSPTLQPVTIAAGDAQAGVLVLTSHVGGAIDRGIEVDHCNAWLTRHLGLRKPANRQRGPAATCKRLLGRLVRPRTASDWPSLRIEAPGP